MRVAAGAVLAAVMTGSCAAPRGPSPSTRPEPWPVGTYRLRVCRAACADTPPDSALSSGTLVLLERDLTSHEMKGLEPTEMWNPHPRAPNACFHFDRTGRPVRSMAGIIPAGATHWAVVRDTVHLALYGSIDANFYAALARTGENLEGGGHDFIAGGKEYTIDHVSAVRTGPADVRLCHGGTRGA